MYAVFATGCAVAWIAVCWAALSNSTDFSTDILVVVFGTVWLVMCGVALRQQWVSMALIERVLGASPSGVVVRRVVRERGNIVGLPVVFANQWATQLAGDRSLKGRLVDVFPGELEEGTFEEYCHVAEGGRSRNFEKRFMCDGRVRWLAVHVAKLEDGGLVVNLVEITKRKEAEERLRHDEELLEMTGRMTKSGGWEILYPQRELHWSPEIYEIYEVGSDFELTI
jgi:hypothetical protein